MKAHSLALRTLFLAGYVAAFPSLAHAYSSAPPASATLRDGGSGCVGCHGAQVPALVVGISGPASVLPGATVQYTIAVSGFTGANNPQAGFNAAVQKKAQQPIFSQGAGETMFTGDGATQIVHGQKKANPASFVVNFAMPGGAVLGDTYTLYATANAGHSNYSNQFGWDHAPNLTVTVAPPTPTSITPNQATATSTSIPLSWAGTQGEHFRVLRKAGSYPSSATDGTATLVHEGSLTTGTASGLTAGTTYFFAAYGKSPTSAFYSASAAQATAGTLPANPTSLVATPAGSTEINLTWSGTSAEFLVLRKTGAYPTSPTDGTATTVHQGAGTSKLDTGLTPGTAYFYRVWGKTAGSSAFSTNNNQATATTNAMPTNRHVNAATGDDQAGANNCSASGTPCRTITRAMNASGTGDSISVAPGTYNLALGEVFPIIFKSGVQLVATGNPSNTIIDAAGDTVKDGIMRSTSNSSSLARIEGFTFRNGLKTPPSSCDSPLGGALYINASTATFTVTRNAFVSNEVRGWSADGSAGETGCLAWGGAIAIFSSPVNITNNVFRGNIARGGNALTNVATPNTNKNGGQGQGGAIYFGGSGSVTNNTFHENIAVGGNGGTGSNGVGNGGPASGGAIYLIGAPPPSVVNNIFSGNSASLGTGGTGETAAAGALSVTGSPDVRNNLFFGNLVNGAASTGDTLGTASVTGDPLFHAAPNDLHIVPASPAAGTGTATGAPATDHDGVTRANPPAIGAYEPTSIPVANPPRLANISTRMQVLTGNDVMIGGFVIGGSANKTVVVRARGPSLIPFGISNALANPTLQLVRSSDQSTLATNDDWQSASNAAQITSSGFAPSNNLESAILMSLPPGAYTAIVSGVGNGTGVGIVEVFEVDGATIPLANISTRGRVLTGNDVMIGGFVVTGSGPQTVVVRARGPSLIPFGIANALANPQLQLVRSSDQSQIAFNDDWQSASNAAQITASGFAPSNNLESAILISLQPGAYTAIVTGVGGGTGVGIVEVFTTP